MKLNEATVMALPVPVTGSRLHYFAGALIQGGSVPRGFAVKVHSSGVRTFVLRYKLGGRDSLYTIGRAGDWSPLNAVKEARKIRQLIDTGTDPLASRTKAQAKATGADTLEAVCELWFAREGRKLRTGEHQMKALRRLVFPKLGKRSAYDLKRTEIVELLDHVEDTRGPAMAAHTLAYLRAPLNWFEGRTANEDWRNPITRSMNRRPGPARARVLSDEELRAVWKATDSATAFNRFVRFVLLTAARRTEATDITIGEVDQTGWTLPAARNKTNLDLLRPLTPQARALLAHFKDGRGRAFASGNYDMKLQGLHSDSGTSGWTIHDLRRTARTLMSRAGVPVDIAERCLGHVIGGIRGVYDLHAYTNEMADAYTRLECLIADIVDPQSAAPRQNVAILRRKR